MQSINKVIALLLLVALLLPGQPLHAQIDDPAGTIFFTVDYLIQAHVPDNQACTADDYTLNIVMEGVGLPNEQGELEGVTIVADLAVNLGPSSWWVEKPRGTHAYPATVKLDKLYPAEDTTMLLPVLVDAIPSTDDFKGRRKCVLEDGTLLDEIVDLDPAQFINTFNLFVLAAGGLKEVEPGNYLSKFHLFVNDDGVRRVEQRVWWGDHRVPGLTIEPDVEGVFLSGVPADVDVTYAPVWADDVNTNGAVWVKLGPGQWIKRGLSRPQPFIEQIPLQPMPPTHEPIAGWVQLDTNQRRSALQSQPFIVAPPQTLVAPAEINATKFKEAKTITYKIEHNMPPVPFEKKWLAPSWFPAPLKGKDVKFKAQLKLIDEYNSTAAPTTHVTNLGFEGKADVGKYSGKLAIKGTANVEYSSSGLNFLSGQGKADLQLGLKETVGPFDLVPTIKPLASAVNLDSWLEQYAKVEAGIYLFGAGDVKLFQGSSGLDWSAVVLTGVRPAIKFQLGKDNSAARFELEAKGEGRIKFHLNMPDDLFQGAEGELIFTGAISVLHCKWSKEAKYTLSSGQATASALAMADNSIADCLTKEPGTISAPEQWLGATALTLRSAQVNPGAQISETLVSQAFEEAAPALDATGHTLCWVTARPDAPDGRDTEITCANGNIPMLEQPQAVTHDTYADAAPQVALAAADTPLVAWWRHDDPNRPGTATLDAEFLSHGEVMASAFDPIANQWGAPVVLGTPGVLDYAPMVAGNATDGALVAWRANPAGELNGFGATPDSLLVARYDPVTQQWGTPEALLTTRGLVDVAAAYGPDEAAVVYAVDHDGVATTTSDTELYLRRWQHGSWQPAVRLTTNAVADTNPQLAYHTDGTPVLVWLQTTAEGGQELGYQAGWTEPMSLQPLTEAAAPTSLTNMAVNAAGDVVTVWRHLYEAADGSLQSDLTFAVREAATGFWSAPLRLTNDATLEHAVSVVWNGDNSLSAVYQQHSDTSAQAIRYLQQWPSAADAAVTAADITLDPVNPAPGTPVTATVSIQNQGMGAQSNVTVTVTEHDAQSGATKRVLYTQTLPVLRGGETVKLTLPYVSSPGANNVTVTLACPNECGDPRNDAVSVAVNQADLVLTGADVINGPFGPFVRAAVTNRGVVSVTLVAMTVTAGLPAGETVLGSTFFAMDATTGLQPGAQAFGEFSLPVENAGSGTVPLTVTVAPAFDQHELTTVDNQRNLQWIRLPDLTLQADFVEQTVRNGETVVTVTVLNDSYLETPATTVTAYSAAPEQGGGVLGRVAVPAIAPYSQAEVSLTLAGTPPLIWLRANADQTFAELSYANNDAGSGQPHVDEASTTAYRVLLPLVSR